MKKSGIGFILLAMAFLACSKNDGNGSSNHGNPKVTILGKWKADHSTLVTVQNGLLLDSALVPGSGTLYDFLNDTVLVVQTLSQGGNLQSSDTLPYRVPDANHLIIAGVTNDIQALDAGNLIYSQTAGDSTIYTQMTWFLVR